jgi:hypothetical protein
MAFKDSVVYNIDANVGKGMPSQRQDVLLVQYFLRDVMNHPDSRAGRPPGNDISVDGLFGNQTETWIYAFQNLVRSKGGSVVVDGKVNKPPSDYRVRLAGGAGYTILHLNATFRRRWRIDHDYLDKCGRVPGELRGALGDKFAG